MNLLYVCTEGIGNLILTLPAIELLREAGHEVTVVGKHPALELVPDDYKAYTLDELENVNTEFDCVLLSPFAATYKERYGYKAPNNNCRVIESDPVDGTRHETELNLDLVSHIEGVEVPKLEDIKLPYIPTDPMSISNILLNLRDEREEGQEIVVFCNTAAPGWEKKRWGGYAELAHLLAKKGQLVPDYKLAVLGTSADAEFMPADAFPEDTHFIYDLPLRQAAALLDEADYVVGNDCGLTHIASALGTKTIALFGPTSQKKNRPLGTFTHQDHNLVYYGNIACLPCQYEAWESVCQVNECMQKITPDLIARHIGQNPFRRTQVLTPRKPQKLAAVIRVKDAIDTIEECLTAAARIVDYFCIVDNGSTDGTLEYLVDYAKKHPDKFLSRKTAAYLHGELKNIPHIVTLGNSKSYRFVQTIGYDESSDRQVLDSMLKVTNATWGILIDSDEIISDQITRDQVEEWMCQHNYNAVRFRHVHFWNDKDHYRVDQRWKPRHNRLMWRITPESTITTDQRVHAGLVRNLKGRVLDTNYVIKHYGHIDKEKNQQRAELYKSMDNPSMPNWSGRTYQHMTDETGIQLAEWHEDTPVEKRDFGKPSLLLVLLHAGGDMLMATPTIAKLKSENPDLQISVMGLGITKERDFKTRQFFENNPNVHAYYDSSIDHHPTWWDARACDALDLPIITKDIQQLQQMTSFDTITIVTLQSDYEKHKIDRFALACGVELSDNEKQMRVYPNGPIMEDEDWVCNRLGLDINGKPIISIHRWCGNPSKSWDYQEYTEFVKRLARAKDHVLLLWDMGDPEPPIRESIIEPNIINMRDYADELTISRSANIMAYCSLHIGADSLPMHLASAVGIPTIGIFERTMPSVAAPIHSKGITATSEYALSISDPDFYEKYAHQIVRCGTEKVSAEHLYPILIKHFPKLFPYAGVPVKMGQFRDCVVIYPKSDAQIYEPLENHEPDVYKALSSYVIQDKSIFMEIGANAGPYMLKLAGLAKKVIAIEPHPEVYDMLQQNAAHLNKHYRDEHYRTEDIIETVNCALSDVETLEKHYERIHLNVSTDKTANAFIHTRGEFLSKTVKLQTLDRLGYRPDVLMIDVNGSELQVLKGAIHSLKHTRAIGIELHGNTDKEVIEFLQTHGFYIRFIRHNYILTTAEGEDVLPFPTNCFFDAAEYFTLKLNNPDKIEGILSKVAEHPDMDNSYWFEWLGKVSHPKAIEFYNQIGFKPDGASKLFEQMKKTIKLIHLNFLFSETGEPTRYRGEYVSPLNLETLEAFLKECAELGFYPEGKTDWENVCFGAEHALPDPETPITRGRLLLTTDIPF